MEMAAIFTATPAEIDTEIARLDETIAQIETARYSLGRVIVSEHTSEEQQAKALAQSKALGQKASILNSLRIPLLGEYTRRGGWTRVYAVNNSNGHFHRSTACQNTYSTTQWIDMPELSGLTNAEVVERTGKMSCLTCFGSERKTIELGREATIFTPAQQKTREEQAALAAKRTEKQAKAAANAITSPDGTPLQTKNYGAIKTVRTAWIEAVGELEWAEISDHYIKSANPQHFTDTEQMERFIASNRSAIKNHCEIAFHIAQAIAFKENRSLADVLTEIVTKADKKIKKNRKDR